MNRNIYKFYFLLFFTAFLVTSTVPIWAVNRKDVKISRIKIQSSDIFDFEFKPYLKKIPYTWINFLHIKTKLRVIQEELLFKEGDIVDDFVIEETERNLRALSFIQAARIAQFPQRDGTVVLVVYVSDSWTTEPQINVQGKNGIDEIEVGFKEKNLFGYGKQMGVFYKTDSGANTYERSYQYKDPRLFHSRWTMEGNYIDRSDGTEENFELLRPFFSAETRWTSGFGYNNLTQTIEDFNTSNVKISEFDETKETSYYSAGLKLGDSRDIVNRAALRYKKEKQTFQQTDKTTPTIPLPKKQEFQTIYIDYVLIRNKFIKMYQLEKMTKVEDINLGPTFNLSPGYQPEPLTGEANSSELGGGVEGSFLFNQLHLLRTNFSYQSRNTFENKKNQLQKVELKHYQQLSKNQTLVIHNRTEWGKDLDPDNKITLGGNNGLRAFENDQFTGSTSFLFNIEDRILLKREVWDLFSIGTVFYFDAGYAWQEEDSVKLSDLKSDVGTGIRLALTHSSNEVVIRMDISYRTATAVASDEKWVLTFGSSQAF